MAGLISIVLFFLIFSVSTVSSTANNTTQFDNITIEWENFTLFTCVAPTAINISLFTCLPSSAIPVDEVLCLEPTMENFDYNTCQATTIGVMYTSIAPATTQQIITVTPVATRPIQISTGVTAATATVQSPTVSITRQASITTGISSTTTVTTSVTTHGSTTTTNTSVTTNGSTTTSTIPVTTNGSTTNTPGYGIVTTVASTPASNIYSCPDENFLGAYCNISSDACAMSQPCQNAATCFPNHTLPYGYYCHCQTGYTGYDCEYDQRACMENTCWHNGTCIPINSTVTASNGSNFRCECAEGYDGIYCELEIDYCGNITCENRGMCITIELTWKCLCLDSTLYYGAYCQFKTGKLKLREILSKSFASVAIGAIVTTCSFVIVMDVLKYAFHIDPVEFERESYRRRLEAQRRARRPKKNSQPKLALRFQYVS